MRAVYHLAIAVFSIGTVATPTAAPTATMGAGGPLPAIQQPAPLDSARNTAADFPVSAGSRQGVTLASHFSRGALVGETLPDDIELHPISRHETYRYAVVNSRRVIVDAASRRVVYVLR